MANQIRGDLTSPITASYNGFSFSPTMETMGCSVKNVFDRARRTVTRKVFTLTIKDRLQSATGLELNATTSFGAARKTLEQPGGALIYEGSGLGGTEVGGGIRFNTNKKDLEWGPRPQMLQWRQLGAGNAVEFIWTVEWSTLDAYATDAGIMEYNYTLSFSVSRAGISRRTYAGYLIIAQTRLSVNDRTLKDNADKYLEKVIPPLLTNFRRIPGEHSLDEAKCQLNFSIVDEELPSQNAPPPGCVEASASHQLETDSVSMLSWHGTISASYELTKDLPLDLAQLYFVRLLLDRLAPAQAAAEAQAVIPIKLSITENDLYGPPKASFSLSYTYTSTLSGLLGAAGLWRPATDNDWGKWSKSLKNTAFAARGIAGLYVNNTDDSILDLGSNSPTVPKTQPGKFAGGGQPKLDLSFFKAPAANKSWIDYQNNIYVITTDETAILKPLPQAPTSIIGSAISIFSPAAGTLVGWLPQIAKGVNTVVQKRAQPTYFVDLIGRALRAGYEIRQPQLLLFAGATCTPRNTPPLGFKAGMVANWGGVPIYAAKWHLRYVLNQAPLANQATVTANVPNLIYKSGKTS